ncbi:helicase-related protein, partial [Pseudomonas aeruginosa]|uniref:helicase-related protein n=1 Tax=Pseudomonas aeruginosa TaxID=287 RepID=UPI0034599B63
DRPAIHGDAIQSWRKYADGKRTMVFAISRAHGQHVTDAYNAAGIPAVYIDGTTPHGERRARIEQFADGRALILVSIALCI